MSVHSMLRLIPIEQQPVWDAYISAFPSGHLLQSWGWGELKAGVGWYPLRLALCDAQQERIVAAAQVLCRPLRHLPLRLGHLAYIPRGPIFDSSVNNISNIAQIFFTQLRSILIKQGALALQAELASELESEESKLLARALEPLRFQRVQPVQPARTIVLDLTLDEDALLANMKEKWRYNVRLAGRKGVQTRVAETLEDVDSWYELLQTTSIRDQFGVHTREYYRQAWQLFAPREQARLLLASYNGQLLAGIFVGLMAKKAIYLYGASSNEQRQFMPNYLLQWEAIRWAKQAGATTYDFWGIPETDAKSEAMAGVYRFKSGWGGRIVRLAGNYECTYRPVTMRLVSKVLLHH
ncbi:MAG TPA: peptidoglycan bridge formation glycyltransferase FemA/FemB family protein [Ktedonobacteraceae bacterium]|nr:peptidoglycan bridge formation glycyltransferase FemA/FemB family protein [Ktedonobacteraceae bacterium]